MRGYEVENKIDSFISGYKREMSAVEMEYGTAKRHLENSESKFAGLSVRFSDILLNNKEEISIPDSVESFFVKRADRFELLKGDLSEIDDKIHSQEYFKSELFEKMSKLSDKSSELIEEDKFIISLVEENEKLKERLNFSGNVNTLVQKEVNAKLKDYEDNLFFKYLLDKGFLSSSYKSKGLFRLSDAWLATKIGYSDNFDNYNLLKGMVEISESAFNSLNETFSFNNAQIKSKIFKIEEEIGLIKVKKDYDSVVDNLSELNSGRDNIISEINAIENDQDTYYDNAVSSFAKILSQVTDDKLIKFANRTETTLDDQVANEMISLRKYIFRQRDNVKSLKDKLESLKADCDKLKKIRNKFIDEDYNSSNYRFDSNFEINKLLTGYMLGHVSSNQIFTSIASESTYVAPTYSSYSSIGSSRISGGSGGFSSTSSMGGSGFSTTGGF